MIYIDDYVIDNGGKTAVTGTAYEGDGLSIGKCGLQIEAVRTNDIGLWSCTLISTKGGGIFTGAMTLGELKSYMLQTFKFVVFMVSYQGNVKNNFQRGTFSPLLSYFQSTFNTLS